MWFRKRSKLDEFGRSELHYAAGDGDASAAKRALAAGADVNLADAQGWTPLHFAAQAQSPAIVALLLEKGATVDVPDRHGNTPLFTAVSKYRGDPGTAEALRAAGADPLKQNHHGMSPVSLARTIANFDVAKCFADLPDNLPADAP
jgi:ankyrin repeat protein